MTMSLLHRCLAAVGLALVGLLGWYVAAAPLSGAPVPASFDLLFFFRVTMTQALSVAMLMLGLFFFSFWMARRSETEYLLLAVAGAVWSVNNAQFIVAPPDDPYWLAWYRALLEQLPIAWLNWLVFQFYVRFVPERQQQLEFGLSVYVLLASVLALPLWGDVGDTHLLATGVYTVMGIGSILLMARLAVRYPGAELAWMAGALLLCSMAGAHDWALRAGWLGPMGVPLIPYSGLLLFGTFLYAVQRRYVGAIRAQEQMGAVLADRLAQRERQLNVQHAQLLALQREHVQATERQRLMRDMHDGLGAHLGAALMLAEQGRLDQGDQLQTLRQAVDDLRAVIDSLGSERQDIADLWASVRHRWWPRLQAAGLQVHWPLWDLEGALSLESSHALDLQRWLHEALANVVKHARASGVSVTAEAAGSVVRITVQDDGVGFDVADASVPGRHGLGNLASRAARLGAVMAVVSRPGDGAVLTLPLPLPLPSQMASTGAADGSL